MLKVKIDYTFETLVPGSKELENGEASARGWASFNGHNMETEGEEYDEDGAEIVEVESLDELKDILSERLGYFYQNDGEPLSSAYACDPDRDLFDGSETYFAAHLTLIK